MRRSPSRAVPEGKAVPGRKEAAGFTLIEFVIAAAVFMVVVAVASLGVIEAERTINTVVARNTDANQAQPIVSLLDAQVREASGATTYGCTGTQCDQLWLYDPSPPSSWPYSCTVWAYDNSSTPGVLEEFASNSISLSTPTLSDLAGLSGTYTGLHLGGVSLPSGRSGIFQIFPSGDGSPGFPGLVDIDLQVQSKTVAAGNSTQQMSSPSQLEADSDDVNISSASGLPPLSSTYPNSNCY